MNKRALQRDVRIFAFRACMHAYDTLRSWFERCSGKQGATSSHASKVLQVILTIKLMREEEVEELEGYTGVDIGGQGYGGDGWNVRTSSDSAAGAQPPRKQPPDADTAYTGVDVDAGDVRAGDGASGGIDYAEGGAGGDAAVDQAVNADEAALGEYLEMMIRSGPAPPSDVDQGGGVDEVGGVGDVGGVGEGGAGDAGADMGGGQGFFGDMFGGWFGGGGHGGGGDGGGGDGDGGGGFGGGDFGGFGGDGGGGGGDGG